MKIKDTKIPEGPIEQKWSNYKKHARLISPANRQKFRIIVVGAGLAGSSAAASLTEQGYQVDVFCFHDSPRRAHSVAAQGGVNAAKNYANDGDSVMRMFIDTLKGGDFRAREANVYRLAECSAALIDHSVAQGVPFGREYGGYLDNRSFGGVQVSRTFYSRGQTGQQLLMGAYQSMMRQSSLGKAKLHTHHEMLELVVENGKAVGIISRNLVTGEIKRHAAHAVVLASGGFGKIYYLSTLAIACNGSAIWRAHKKGAWFANPSWTQIHPTCLPQMGNFQSKLTLMSESLRNDGRIWVPKKQNDTRHPNDIPEEERDYYLERRYPAYGNLAPRDISSRAAKERIDAGYGVGPERNAVYLDFKDAIHHKGIDVILERYGNLFEMYEKITGMDACKEPMMIAPAAHFSMGGLWVDYELMSNLPGLYAIGEANFGDHGANRLGANSLLQACVDGYFILPYTLPNYLAQNLNDTDLSTYSSAFEEAEQAVKAQLDFFLNCKGDRSIDSYHKELGNILTKYCSVSRTREGLETAIDKIKALSEEFKSGNIWIPSDGHSFNTELEKAGRMHDYLELGILMCIDALVREESCGAHFREEYQTPDGEALRNDEDFAFNSLWAWNERPDTPFLHKEELEFEFVEPIVRSYK
jgi:succinate dehydrogenase / fumarate reductase, flavoprotein subunit